MGASNTKNLVMKVGPAFEDFLFNYDYETYVLMGGYGSGKSYAIAQKVILKSLEENRKTLVLRQVYDTIKESCYDLLCQILEEMDLLTTDPHQYHKNRNKALALQSPLRILFHNGSRIIFKGLDKPDKVKSINRVSIVWLEECAEVNYAAYKEILGRIRIPDKSMHFYLSFNPVGKENWVYSHFFLNRDDDGIETRILDEERLYEKGCVVKNGVYYHHSVPTDNPWLPWQYLKRIDDLQKYDYQMYLVARWGRFGATGTRVLPQIVIPHSAVEFKKAVDELGPSNYYYGFDFGFEDSYNAVLSMAVDVKRGYLYVFDEIYCNHITDDKMAQLPAMLALREKLHRYNEDGYNRIIVADNEDPKAIQYYRQEGYPIRGCRNKFQGSRLSNTRKIKRFKKIFISPKCKNTLRELRGLTYKKNQQGNAIYDQFNIDPHTFSAIWYGLDSVTVADVKDKTYHSKGEKVGQQTPAANW